MATSDRTAIITGAASGLGRALALRLAQDHWHLALADIDLVRAEETRTLVEAAGGQAEVYSLNVADQAAWIDLVEQLRKKWEHLDLLINMASKPSTAQAILTADLGGGPGLVLADPARSVHLCGVPLREPLPVGTVAAFDVAAPVEVRVWGPLDDGQHVVVDVRGTSGLRLYPAGPVARLGLDALVELFDSAGWLADHA